MTCSELSQWMLSARCDERLPDECHRHLKGCPACRSRWEQLGRLNHWAKQLGALPASESTRQQFNRRLAITPQFPLPSPPRSCKPQRPRLAIMAGLLAFLLAITGLVIYLTPPSSQRPAARGEPLTSRPLPTPQAARDTPSLLLALLKQASRIAQPQPNAQPTLDLLEVASQIREEAFRLAARGRQDEVKQLTRLHDWVLRTGLVNPLAESPDSQRRSLAPSIRDALHSAWERSVISARDLAPAAAELVQPLADALQQAERAVADNRGLPVVAAYPLPDPPLVARIVETCVRLASRSDPLLRAEVSAALAEEIAFTTVILAASGDEEADQWSVALDEFLGCAVADNLEQVENQAASEDRRRIAERIRAQAARATTVLEDNWRRAPPAAKAGLQRALDATQGHGHLRAGPSRGKGVGPPWLRHDSTDPSHTTKTAPNKKMPPGLSKKEKK